MFTCRRCGTENAITLPSDGNVSTVTCVACHADQPRRDYEVERLAAQFHSALEQASSEVDTTSPGDEEFRLCPSCESVLVPGETGCPRCGYGRPSFLDRHATLLRWLILLVLATCLVVGAVLLALGVFAGAR